MFSLLTAIENAGSTDGKAIIAALQALELTGTRGDIEFSPGGRGLASPVEGRADVHLPVLGSRTVGG